MKSRQMTEFLDYITEECYGRKRSMCIDDRQCVACGKPAIGFKNELEALEFDISGLCSDCQESIFKYEEEE